MAPHLGVCGQYKLDWGYLEEDTNLERLCMNLRGVRAEKEEGRNNMNIIKIHCVNY